MSSYKSALAFTALTLVTRGVHAWYPNLPACVDTYQPFTSLGCYDNAQPGALMERMDMDAGNMTTEACTAVCKGNGFGYAGLAYVGTCYCGNTINTKKVDSGLCNKQCSGNSAETCGGDASIALYKDETFPDITAQTTDAYAPMGCYTDDNHGRPVFFRQDSLSYSNLTTKACLQSCLAGGFPYAATEYAGECYCGVVLGKGVAPADSSECNMPCNGASGEMCGGRNRQNVYWARPLACTQPCGYKPPVSPPSTSSVSPMSSPVPVSSITSTIASSEAVEVPSSTPVISTSSPLPESSSAPVCNAGYGEAIEVPSSTPVISTPSPLPESSSAPACEAGHGYGGCAPTAPTVVESTSTIASSEAISIPSSTPSTPIASTSSPLSESSSSPLPESSSTPVCHSGYGYKGCTPTAPTVAESTSSIASSGAVTVPSSTPIVSTPETLPASSPSAPSSYAASTPSTSTETISISSTLAMSSSTTSSFVVNIPSISTSTYIVSTSSSTTSSFVVNIPSTSTSTYVVSKSSSSPIVSISSTKLVSTSTTIVKIPSSSSPVLTIPASITPTPLTTLKTSIATASVGVCTSVVVSPPKCDFGCGKWCYTLPEFKDGKGCMDAWSHCAVNVASCYLKAGIPDALNCNGFAQWCGKVQDYCKVSPAGNKDSCTKAWPPVKPTSKLELTTTTMTVPCTTTSKVAVVTSAKPVTTTLTSAAPAKTTTGTCAIATPTGICQQPKNARYGYDASTPLGGIKLPALTCNNVEAEHRAGSIYKLYTDQDTKKCASFKAPKVADACSQACRTQYDQCVSVYAEGCRTKGKYGGQSFGLGYSPAGVFVGNTINQAARPYHRRTLVSAHAPVAAAVSFVDSYDGAKTKCVQQMRDCLDVNKNVVSDKCKKYGVFS
ncbi:WSC-domain-containing protein [Apiospora rasikravindrae]|uniref:WSC-domain-containing protein n=1 Tax=Apiospora rasikravindrae TaxID=990691 RepID=A0ABR1UF99_9PEZI